MMNADSSTFFSPAAVMTVVAGRVPHGPAAAPSAVATALGFHEVLS
jgi:hypothetical protein